jgi:hypothetical protein
MEEADYISAHRHCIRHRDEIEASESCGCFYCLEIYSPSEIIDWVEESDPPGFSALCPRCDIDAVIGSASGYPITKGFLEQMNHHWFGE